MGTPASSVPEWPPWLWIFAAANHFSDMGCGTNSKPPRRRCQAATASDHETALHYLVGCGDVEAVRRALERGWAFGAVVDEDIDFFAMSERDLRVITTFPVDPEATTKDCREDLGRDRPGTTAMDMLLANEINWTGAERGAEMVGALLHGRPPTAKLLWKARNNLSVAREVVRRGAPFTDAVVDTVPEPWRRYMGDSPFTMLAHAFFEALWEPDSLYRPAAAKRLSKFIDLLLDVGERGKNGDDGDGYSWEIMFWELSAQTCLRSRIRRALGWS